MCLVNNLVNNSTRIVLNIKCHIFADGTDSLAVRGSQERERKEEAMCFLSFYLVPLGLTPGHGVGWALLGRPWLGHEVQRK